MKRYGHLFAIVFFLQFGGLMVSCQAFPKLDNVLANLSTRPMDTNTVGLYERAFNHFHKRRKAIGIARKLADSILFLSEKLNYAKGIANAHYHHAEIDEDQGDYLSAMSHLNYYFSYHKQREDRQGVAHALLKIGKVYGDMGDYENAVLSITQCANLYEKLDYKKGLAWSYIHLGAVNERYDKNTEAINFYKKGASIFKDLGSMMPYVRGLDNIADLYAKIEDHKTAMTYYQKMLDLAEEKIDYKESEGQVAKRAITSGEDINMKANPDEMTDESYILADGNESDSWKYAIYNRKADLRVSMVRTKYKKAQEVATLLEENELEQAKTEKQKAFRNTLIFGLLVVVVVAVFSFYFLRQRLKSQKILAAKSEELKTANLKGQLGTLEMKALRAQMNPHFLFNCMNSINRMILEEENNKASTYLSKFSKLVRLMLENSERPKVSLKDELEMLTSYIQLESIRFKNKMDYRINVSEEIDAESIFIPSLVLQPFVENAIWHGLMHKDTKGLLTISINEEGDNLRCKITDNGVGREKALRLKKQSGHKKMSMGIKISSDRLKLLTKQKICDAIRILDLKDSQDNATGTQVNILIPIS